MVREGITSRVITRISSAVGTLTTAPTSVGSTCDATVAASGAHDTRWVERGPPLTRVGVPAQATTLSLVAPRRAPGGRHRIHPGDRSHAIDGRQRNRQPDRPAV